MIIMEYIIIDEEGYVEKCNTDREKDLLESFGLAHYNILRLNNGKIQYAHWTYEDVKWKDPKETKKNILKIKDINAK